MNDDADAVDGGQDDPTEAGAAADMGSSVGGHDDPRFQEAVDLLRAGRLAESEQRVRAILQGNQSDAQAIHLLGVIAHQARKTDVAIDLVRRAVDLAPEVASYRNTLGFFLRVAKRPHDALEHLRKAVDLRPDYGEAHNNLGIALAETGDTDGALAAYEVALAENPAFPEALNNLGNILARSGRLEAAMARYDEAIAARPDYAEAWSNKADAILALDNTKREEAAACYAKATELNPRWAEALVKLGVCYHGMNRLAEAEDAFRGALRINPRHVRCLTSIAATLEKRGNLEGAAAHLRHALTIAPDDVTGLKSLGHVTLKLGNAIEAKHVLARARELAPADPDAIYSYANCLLRMEQLQPAMDLYLRVRELQPNQARGTFAPAAVLLMDGQYEKGWAAYESRYAMSAFKPNVPNIRERLWDGSPLNGRTLLVHVEQGFGDTIQFARYIPMLRGRAGADAKIIFLCEPELHRQMKTLDGVDELYHLRQADLTIVYDAQVPLLSLPHRFGTTLETVPNAVPYLAVAPDAARPDGLPRSDGAVVKAAIAWTGRPTHSDNLYRSLPLSQLATLFDLDGVDFHSIQVGNGVADFQAYVDRPNVFDHSKEIKDFADTAAILSEVDVLISVDTAVVHLAGALGKDVWTMLPYGGEWRWLRNREDTPWYPTMRLVRQRILGDWGQVLERVREGLEGVVSTRRGRGAVPAWTAKAPPGESRGDTAPASKKAAGKKAAGKKAAGKKSASRKGTGKAARAKKETAKKR
jgi:tetratricopeptide (TPR) repeat protein